jgi:hypothetical protein
MDIQDAQRENAVCLHKWVLGTACFIRNLAGCPQRWALGSLQKCLSWRHHRGILHLPACSNGAGYVGSHFATALSRTDFLA